MIAPISPRTPIIGGRKYNELVRNAQANTWRFNPSHFRIQGNTVSLAGGDAVGSSSSDKSRWKLTRTSGSSTVTVGPGSVLKGSWIEGAETSVTVGGGSEDSPHYIYATIDLSANTITIAANTVASKPTSTATQIKVILHTVYRSGASVVHLYQNQASDIILDKPYA